MKILEIIKPDDWHVHFREGKLLEKLVPETSKLFNRAIVMPNLSKPIIDSKKAIAYKNQILKYGLCLRRSLFEFVQNLIIMTTYVIQRAINFGAPKK